MAGKKSKKILSITASILTMTLILSQSTFAFDAESNKSEQAALQKQAEQYESTLKKTRNDISEKQAYAKALQGKIETLSKQIKLSNEKIDALNKSIKEKQAEIDEKLSKIEGKMTQLRARLRAIYMAGDTSSLEIILGAKDFSDFIDKAELVESISSYDSNLINELKTEMSTISEQQKSLQAEKASVEKEKKSLESQKSEINKLSEENSNIIAELQGVESATLDSIGENKESQAALEKELKEYFEQQKKQAEENAKKQQNANNTKPSTNSNKNNTSKNNTSNNNSSSNNNTNNGSNNTNNTKPDDNNKDNDNDNDNPTPTPTPTPSSGEYVWPCPGFYYLISTFDENRGSSNHGALDIAGSGIYGAQVIAAREGTVVSSFSGCTHDYGKSSSCGCGGGYGNYVVIEHSDGKTSLYGHLSAVYVNYGDYVSTGQLIGRVGSTGYSTGPHLHFETKYSTIWDHSQRYNPLDEYPGLF